MPNKKQYMVEVRSLAFLVKEDGITIIVTRSADKCSEKYIVTIENLFGAESRLMNRKEIKLAYNIEIPVGF
jgi:hypothetical protein